MMALLLAQEAQDPEEPRITAGYDGGFTMRGKEARLTIEGLLQINGRFFEPDGQHESEFVLRRMRLEFSGEFYERWLFHIEPKFVEDGVELEEAWAGFQVDVHSFRFGRMKEPFSWEEMASQRHMDMLNFSILNQFTPAEDHGITVLGNFDILEYGVGFYNGTGGDDTTSDKDGALRLVLHPWRGLQFGGASTYGRQNSDVSGEELRTEARVPWALYVPGTTSDGERVRLGAEAAFLEGPLAVVVELMRIREELNDTTVHYKGGYVQASYVLTGEGRAWKGERIRIWKGVTPDRPFLKDPDLGAWQVTARWSRLKLDDELIPFLTTFPERIDSYTIGLNWTANEFVKIKLNYLRTEYEEKISIAGKRRSNEDALLLQFQLSF